MARRLVIALAFCGMAAMLAGCLAGIDRDLQYADSLEKSAERLRQHGHAQNAAALEQEAQRQRKEARSLPGPLNLGAVRNFFNEPASERSTLIIRPAEGQTPASPDF